MAFFIFPSDTERIMFKKLRSLSVIKMEQHSHSGELKQKGEIRLLRIVCIAASTVTAISGPFL